MWEYDTQLKRLRFSLPDDILTLEKTEDYGATYVRAKEEDERFYIVARPASGAMVTFLALNPSVAFDLANAILEQGTKIGWYKIDSVDGDAVPKTRQ
jgi:hypothetical protein